MSMTETMFLIFGLAFFVEGFVEYAVGSWVDGTRFEKHKVILGYLAMGLSVALAFYYQLDLLVSLADALFENPTIQASPVGFVITGVIMGRGSEYLHKFVSRFLDKPSE